jgi:hypothetical protein
MIQQEEPRFYTPSGRVETSIHRVKDIAVSGVQEGKAGLEKRPFFYQSIVIKTNDNLKYRLELFADNPDGLIVRFSG